MSSQLFVTWFDVAGHQHLKTIFLAPWLLPWIYPWDLPCISYSLLIPWVLPCWHPWVLPCHLDTLGVQCTLNILVPLIYQQFRSDFIIAALTPLLSPTLPSCILCCPPTICNLLKFRPVPPSFPFWFIDRNQWAVVVSRNSLSGIERESGFYPEWGWMWSIRSSLQIDEHSVCRNNIFKIIYVLITNFPPPNP